MLDPKSEFTLDQEEFKSLINFLQENYEPFRKGVKAYIPLDDPYDQENANQIRALFSQQDKTALVEFIISNNVIPHDLEIAVASAKRINAVHEFEQMLGNNETEHGSNTHNYQMEASTASFSETSAGRCPCIADNLHRNVF